MIIIFIGFIIVDVIVVAVVDGGEKRSEIRINI